MRPMLPAVMLSTHRSVGNIRGLRSQAKTLFVASSPITRRSRRIGVEAMKGRLAGIEPVEIAHQHLQPDGHSSCNSAQSISPLMAHFAILTDLAAHEEQLLAGMAPHERTGRRAD